jgi:hypothetical protein
MSVAEIKTAIRSISSLPPKQRKTVVAWAFKTLSPETFGVRIRKAFREGKLDGLISRAEADYASGKALDTLD